MSYHYMYCRPTSLKDTMSHPRSKTKERNWSPIRLPGEDDRSKKDARDHGGECFHLGLYILRF